MAYGQRVAYHITPIGYTILIRNAKHEWGKFYDWPDQDKEVDPNGWEVLSGKTRVVAASGRESASSGTEGSFEIVDAASATLIGTFKWNCPWSGSNSWSYDPSTDKAAEKFVTQVTGGSVSGPIGDITVKSCKCG